MGTLYLGSLGLNTPSTKVVSHAISGGYQPAAQFFGNTRRWQLIRWIRSLLNDPTKTGPGQHEANNAGLPLSQSCS